MKMTVEIPDPALDPSTKQSAFRLKPFGFKGEGQQLQDWSVIRELAHDGCGESPEAED